MTRHHFTSRCHKFKTRDISPSEITISSLDEQLIEKAIRIVEENMDNSEFSVEELSAQIGMSRSGLYKKLMQITGHQTMEALEKYLREIDAALPEDYSHLLN